MIYHYSCFSMKPGHQPEELITNQMLLLTYNIKILYFAISYIQI